MSRKSKLEIPIVTICVDCAAVQNFGEEHIICPDCGGQLETWGLEVSEVPLSAKGRRRRE